MSGADPDGLLKAFRDAHPDVDPNEVVQLNVRVPRWLFWAVDQRRARLRGAGDKPISRDRWVIAVLKFALRQPGNPVRSATTVARTSRGRTIRPGGNR